MSYRAGADIGGTFTDVIVVDESTGNFVVNKLLTTGEEPARAVVEGISKALQEWNVPAEDLSSVVHGTTLVANTILQRDGARILVLTTEGFEDLLEMRREQRYDSSDLFPVFPEPLAPASLCAGVRERVLSDGRVHVPVDEDHLREMLRGFRGAEIEAVAICLLHSFRNPAHEESVARIVGEELPEAAVSLSSGIAPQIGEYERLSTTAANAYVQPVVSEYLARLETALDGFGGGVGLYLMLSDGGVTSARNARERPVQLIESGPAANVAATCRVGERQGETSLVAFDMGGTTAKFCIVDGGRPQMTWNTEVAQAHRFRKGSGLPLSIPSIEMLEIGAGGGSIARVDELGLPQVGPISAGSDPGPCCYGLGGTRPTVTDALAALGYLNPDYFLGGRLPLSVERAREAIEREVADPLGLEVEEAALGIYRLACQQMAESMRTHFAENGRDPRRYTMVASGGAGPAHACELARALEVPRVVVPRAAGIMSAVGLLVAPFALNLARSLGGRLDQADPSFVNGVIDALADEATRTLAGSGVPGEEHTLRVSLDLRYFGQRDAVEVPLEGGRFGPDSMAGLVEQFETLYAVQKGRANRALAIELARVRVNASVAPAVSDLGTLHASGQPRSTADTRTARFVGADAVQETPTFAREQIEVGSMMSGPAIVEDRESTIVIGIEDRFERDSEDSIVIEIGSRDAKGKELSR